MESTAVVFNKEKGDYGPIASSLIQAAKNKGLDIKFFTDDLSSYKNLIVFYNRPFSIGNEDQNISWWMCDLRSVNEIPKIGRYDNIFLCNKEHQEAYAKQFNANVHYLPQCGDDREEIPREKPLTSDVVFIGNFTSQYHRNRWNIIKKIMETHDVQVITGLKYTPETKYIYRTTPFSLAISDPVKGYTSNRLYNILASKGLCLTLYFPGIEDLFENHKHLVWFKKAEEVKDIIEYYYDHPEEYDKIREQGHKLYQEKHTAEARLETICNSL